MRGVVDWKGEWRVRMRVKVGVGGIGRLLYMSVYIYLNTISRNTYIVFR